MRIASPFDVCSTCAAFFRALSKFCQAVLRAGWQSCCANFVIAFVVVCLSVSQVSAQLMSSSQAGEEKIPAAVAHQIVSAAQLQRLRASGDYVPIARQPFFELLKQRDRAAERAHSPVEHAEYTATLSGTKLIAGLITLTQRDIDGEPNTTDTTLLGETNLQQLRLFSESNPLQLATDSLGRLVLLESVTSPILTGKWELPGTSVGSAVVFQLQLPASTISTVTIRTDAETILSSQNALISVRRAGSGELRWTLYPTNASALTINSTSRADGVRTDSVGLTVNAECQFQRYGGSGVWTVDVPQSLTDTILQFGFSESCDVKSVTLANGSPLRWEVQDSKLPNAIRVWVPAAAVGATLQVRGQLKTKANSIAVPFLVPDSWRPALTEIGRPLLLRGRSEERNRIRVQIAPDLVVTDVDSSGVFEEQVQYAADNSQVLVFNQYAQDAKARLTTVPSIPVVEDALVLLPSDDDGQMDALISVMARSGSVGELEWDVATSWRVTEVSEATADVPLLFRLADSGKSDSFSRLIVTLRTPIVAGAALNLRIQLQSTGGNLQREIPRLLNLQYQRQYDYFVPSSTFGPFRRQASTDGVSLSTLRRTVLGWLPTGLADERLAIPRRDLLLTADVEMETPSTEPEMIASPDEETGVSDSSLLPQATGETADRMILSGNGFIITSQTDAGLCLESMYRLAVTSRAPAENLVMNSNGVDNLLAFVNGREVYPEKNKDTYVVPLGEQAESAIVELYATTDARPAATDAYTVPVFEFPNVDAVELNYFVLAPSDHTPVSSTAKVETESSALAEITQMVIARPSLDDSIGRATEHTQFAARWQFQVARHSAACLMASGGVVDGVRFQLYDLRFDAAKTLVVMLVSGLLWGCLLRSFTLIWLGAGLATLALTAGYHMVPITYQPIIAGLIYGTMLAGLVQLLLRLKLIWRPTPVSNRAVIFQSAVILILLPGVPLCAVEEPTVPLVLVPDNSLPVLYVESDWLQLLQDSATSQRADAYVTESRIDVELLPDNSATVDVQCSVAVEPSESCELSLPLDGLTLIRCTLDGVPVFPVRNAMGGPSIVIPPTSVLPPREIDRTAVRVESVGPNMVGNRMLRAVSYTVRVAAESGPAGLQFSIPHPPSSVAQLTIQDPTELAATVKLKSVAVAAQDFQKQRVTFGAIYNSTDVNFVVMLGETTAQSDVLGRPPEIICRASVAPSRVELACEYRFLPVEQRSQTVRIGTHRDYRITTIETLSGERLEWAVEGTELVIPVDSKLAINRSLVVKSVSDTAMRLTQRVPLRYFTMINGRSTDDVILLPTTLGLFLVNAVKSDDSALPETPASSLAELPDGLRPTDRIVRIASGMDRVDVQLSRQQTAREVSTLVQKAVVTEDYIQWSCRCEIDVAGEPAFRQSFKLSPEVQIQKITASNSDVPRLQSWHRNGELITVALREGIRGSLVLEIHGYLERQPLVDTSLPTIELPIEILEPVLEISSPESDIFVSDFGGTRPNIPIDIKTTPISQTPIVLTIIDESDPLSIRATPRKRIIADAALLAYQVGERTFLAQYFTLNSSGSTFSVPFETPGVAAFSTATAWISNNAEMLSVGPRDSQTAIRVTPATDDEAVVVGLTEIVMAADTELVAIPLPDFGVEVVLENVQAFDLRRATADFGADSVGPLPDWLYGAAVQTIDTPFDYRGRKLECRPNGGKIEVRIRQPEEQGEIPKVSEGITFAAADHHVRLNQSDLIMATSGLLCFSMQPGQVIRVEIPPGITPTQVQVDGRTLPFEFSQEMLTVAGAGRVCFVAIDWIRSLRDDTSGSVMLPTLKDVQATSLATVIRSDHSRWKVTAQQQNQEQIDRDRLRSLTTGLQLIESETLTDDSSFLSGADPDMSSLPTGPVWGKLAKESSDSAQRFAAFLQQSGKAGNPSQRVDVVNGSILPLRHSPVPSAFTALSMLFAVVFFLVPVLGRERLRKHRVSEASTIVSVPPDAVNENTETKVVSDVQFGE